MKTQQSWITLALVGVGAIIALLLVFSSNVPGSAPGSTGQSNGDAKGNVWNTPTPAVKPPTPYTYGVRNLVGASPEKVAEYAVDYFIESRQVRSGTPQLLAVRPIKPQELPELDLGCPLSFGAIEEPPLMLVVLKGDFHFRYAGMGNRPPPDGPSYVAAIFDIWAAQPTFITSARDGKGFGKVLNDPSLPTVGWGTALACPTEPPRTKTVHYGKAAPGWLTPPVPLPSVSPSIETPIPTPVFPSPVPTSDS